MLQSFKNAANVLKIALLIASLVCSGCTVYKTIKVTSEPSGLRVHKAGAVIGVTPCESEVGAGDGLFCTPWYWSFVLEIDPAEVGQEKQRKLINPCAIADGATIHFDMRIEKPNNKTHINSTQGTGFLLSEAGYLVTNHHVVKDKTEIEVVFPHKNVTFDAEVQIKDTSNDLVILKLKDFAYNEMFAEEVPYALKPSGDVKLGEQVFTLGFPLGQVLGKSVKLSDGTISALSGIGDNASVFQISNPIQPGNSGGPLFDKQGHLIGIVVATLNAKLFLEYADTIPQNVNFAIKSDYLINLVSMIPEGDLILKRDVTLDIEALEKQVEALVPYIVTVYAKN